jgi:hypothetical protein
MQWFGKHVPVAMNTHGTIEEFLDPSFSMWSMSYQRKVGDSSSQNFLFISIIFIIINHDLFFCQGNMVQNYIRRNESGSEMKVQIDSSPTRQLKRFQQFSE